MSLDLNELKSKVSDVSDKIKEGKTKLSSAKTTIDSMKNSIMNNKLVNADQISSLTNVVSSANLSASSVLSSVSSLKEDLKSKIPDISDKLSGISSDLSSVQNIISDIGIKENNTSSDTTKNTDIKDSEVADQINITKDEAMAYDSNGLKHFMNIFLDTLSSEKISFEKLGMRRWALSESDEKIFGNAFLEKQSEETYKILDSDNKKYWLSDYNSRHFYGEAVDIGGSLTSLMESIAKNNNVLDVMHHFGICIQVETSQSGASKGTHFHASTDKDNPQTKWWGIVNQIRDNAGLKLYTVVADSEYYEEETKNDIVFA